ncbi:MAG: hypothetical protein F2520_12075 [Actinobacteria bacterium]|uniref:Unannotated protein n=1 Tax=freshwater metagenome TaxID=449393 RepID=A0A6J7IP70_9ZZZZ|nr:hypothetical protein [Actinomycetota bacterium]MTA78987.1 hypothetical protein [Actinomycetota bacterium]
MSRDRDRGQSTVELAVALPFIVILFLLIVQVGLVVRDHLLVVHGTREAVRAAAVALTDRHGAAVFGAQRAGPLDPERLRVIEEVLPGGDRVRVRIDYSSATDLPLVGVLLPDIGLSADAVMRLETPEGSAR